MIVELSWNDELGESWMNEGNLFSLLYTSQCVREELLSARDITQRCEIDSRKSDVLSGLMTSHDL
jgi:hypothetical protein